MKFKNLFKIGVCLMLTMLSVTTQAQQQSQYTQFRNVGLTYNPAFSGANDQLNATILSRWQWVGFEGAPRTQAAMVDTSLPNDRIGLGLFFTHDEVGVSDCNRITASYAYHLPVWKGRLSLGLSGSLNSLSTNFSELSGVEQDGTFANNTTSFNPNFGFGLLYLDDRLTLGFSIPELINSTFEEDGVEQFEQQRHTYVQGGYRYPVSQMITLEGNALLRFVAGSPLAADVNAMAWYNERFGGGVAHRFDESVSAIVQLKIQENLTLGYAYDMVTNDELSNLSNSSHEVLLTYSTPLAAFTKKRKKDQDNDGILDKEDECPTEAGPLKNGGCPLPDSDKDGVPDEVDKCPLTAGPALSDGCPDADGDGFIDKIDKCPQVPGARYSGCPDTDGDGVIDKDDQCPDIAGFKKSKGCLDSDMDGVWDHRDECPNEAGPLEYGGCPKVSKADQEVLKEALKGIQFESGRDVLKSSSYATLDKVVKLMSAHSDYQLKISGYTDSAGNNDNNLKLSEKRAQTVKAYLVKNGIESGRLIAKGYGESNPIADNSTAEGRKENRRVELEIE